VVSSLGADVHMASLLMAGKVFGARGMGEETGVSAVLAVGGGFGKSVLLLGRSVVRVLMFWRDLWILDRDGW
jgi:hypothetical protein